MEVKTKQRVNFRFDEATIVLLEKMQKSPNPLFNSRPITWLVEYAVTQQYQPIVDAVKEPA